MSDVLDTAIEFTAATTRWSKGGSSSVYMSTGTLWYGMMCRSFVLLEKLLRYCLREFSHADESLVAASRRCRGHGKPLDALTMGQCLAVLEDLAPRLTVGLTAVTQSQASDRDLLPKDDYEAWQRIVSKRNRIAHDGPGFFDSVDLFSGRTWRKYEIDEPLHEQATEVWRLGRKICRSAVVLTCVERQGVAPEHALEALDKAESVLLGMREISRLGNEAINALHGAVKPE